MPYTKEQMADAVSIASKYAPGGGSSKPPRKNVLQEMSRRIRLRKRRRADKKKLKKLKHGAATEKVRRGLSQAGVDKGTFESY
jgi:hypothetical protein